VDRCEIAVDKPKRQLKKTKKNEWNLLILQWELQSENGAFAG
jgi:hypothetical protein